MSSRSRTVIIAVALLCTLLAQTTRASTRLSLRSSDQRYVDLLISADDAFFGGTASIEQLKSFLADFSDYLAQATQPVGRKLSLGTVRLLVPRSRVDQLRAAGYALTRATWESEANADILVDSMAGDTGSVLHSGFCSEAGTRIRMPAYLMRSNTPGKAFLTRLFAQYRWGALPETGIGGAKFYLYAEQFQPVRCSRSIPGKYRATPDGEAQDTINVCIMEVDGALKLHDDCAFIADKSSAKTYASIMSDYGIIGYVKRFCDTSVVDDLIRHNGDAPTLHSQQCGAGSVADVIRQHADFGGAGGTASDVTVPELILIEPPPNRKIVLMLDISGSMVGDRMRNLITAATRYVQYFVETGAEVALASFNGSVQVLQPLRALSSLSDRQQLSASIQGLVAAGWTNIADAITVSMQLLGASPPYNASQTGFVVLITDGEHNLGPSLNDSIANASMTSIVFDTVSISNQADRRMAQLATDTGGWPMFSSANASIPITTELDTAFAKLADRSPSSNRSVLLSASTFSLPMEPISMKIDASVTTSLHFMLSIPNANLATLNVTAKDPNGKVYGKFLGSNFYEENAAINSVLIKIPDINIVVGTWTIYVTSAASTGRRKRDLADTDEAEAVLLSRRRRDTSAVSGSVVVIGGTSGSTGVSIDAWVRYVRIPQVTSAYVQRIYATILNATGAPVTGARVQAIVMDSTGRTVVIGMTDDGLGFDSVANDGTYIGALMPEELTSTGEYSVTVKVLEPLNRVTSAGTFRVEALASGSVSQPPARIVDLAVSMSVVYRNLTVQFTAPGNESYYGTAASYELRASSTSSQLQSAFAASALISRISGQPAGSKIRATIPSEGFPSDLNVNATFYLSAAAVSTSGLTGQAAMPVAAMLAYPNNWTPTAASTSSDASTCRQPLRLIWLGLWLGWVKLMLWKLAA